MLIASTFAALGLFLGITGLIMLTQPNPQGISLVLMLIGLACFYPIIKETQKVNKKSLAIYDEHVKQEIEKHYNSEEDYITDHPNGLRSCLKCHEVGIFQINSRAYGCSVTLLTFLLPLIGYLIYRVVDKATRNYKCYFCGSFESVPINTQTGKSIYFALSDERRRRIMESVKGYLPSTKPDLQVLPTVS